MDKSYLNPFAEPEELADTCLKILGLDLACQYLRDSDYTNIRDAKGDGLGVVCEHADVSVLVTVKVSFGDGFPDASASRDELWEMARSAVEYQSENPEVRDVRCDVLAVSLVSSTQAKVKHAVGVFDIGRGGEEDGLWTIAAECGSDTTKDLMEAPLSGLNAYETDMARP